MDFKCSRIVFVLCCLSASRSCPALQPDFRFQKDSVSHFNHDIRDIGYVSFEQKPNSPVVTAGKGHLAFRPQWKGVISTPPYEYIRKIVSDALKIWSEFVLEDVELRVAVEFKTMDTRINAGAVPKFAKMKTAEFVALLQQRLKKLGFGKLVFPSGDALLKAVSSQRPAGLEETIWMDIPAPVAKNLLPQSQYTALYGKFDSEFSIDINDRLRNSPVERKVTAMIGNGMAESVLQTTLHEIGHGLGFVSALGNNYDTFKFWCPMPLDLFRFKGGASPRIDFATTPRFFDSKSASPHILFDPYPLEGRTPVPEFESGDQFEASHWKDNSYPNGYFGIMDPNRDMGMKSGFTPADKRAFSRLGYKMNDLPKPVIYEIWRKKTVSGTYFGVSGHLMLTPTVDYLFESENRVQHIITAARTVSHLAPQDTRRDIVKFLDRRESFLQVLRLDPRDPLPDLRSSSKWKLCARNTAGGKYGPWSEPVTFNGNWNSLPLLDQWDYEVGRDGENWATGPSASFKPYPIVDANGRVLSQTVQKPTSTTTQGGKPVAKGATKSKSKP